MSEGRFLKDSERQRCEVWTRVMGYFRPVSEYNPGKKSEHEERIHFKEGCGESTKSIDLKQGNNSYIKD